MAMVELAASRRAVVRSERFMEWQRELIRESSYGGRKRQHPDDNSLAPKKSDEEEQEEEEDRAQEEKRESEEQDANPHVDAEANHVANGDESEIKKQQQKKGLSAKKRIRRFQGSSKGDRQQETSVAPLRRTQRRILAASERNFRFFTRSRATSPPAAEASRGSKRSKRVAQKLANEEPPPAPLRLPKLHLVLTRKEIQEDWMKMTGHKYTGKPKKSTLVQRGFGLCTSLTCPSSIRYLNDPQ